MSDQLIQEATNSLERLKGFDPQLLVRREELGSSMAFVEAVVPAQRVIALFQQIPSEFLTELPSNYLTQIRDYSNTIFSIFVSISKFTPEQENPTGNKSQLMQQLQSQYDSAFQNLHPVISYLSSRQRDFAALERQARSAVQSATDQIDALKENLQKSEEEAKKILEEVRRVAAEQGVSQQASYFKGEADEHEKSAHTWKKYTIFTAIGLGAFAFLSFFIHKIPYLLPSSTYEAIQLTVSKGLMFAVIAYMLILCARNFLSHKHNAIVNRHRQNALLTFNALASAAGAEDKRDIVLTHAAACIFSPQETGYAKSSGSESGSIKLIEIAPKVSGGSSPS